MKRPSAGCAIIGDEILTGKVHDQNSHTLAKVLFEQGVRFCQVQTVLDDVDTIARVVRELSDANDFVFTSGGIGPTHDDMTYAGVARAFGRELATHEETLERMTAWFKANPERGTLNAARKRMAVLPEGCDVLYVSEMWVPLVVMENVHVLPGVPWLFKSMLEGIRDRFKGTPLARVTLTTLKTEGDIADILSGAQDAHPDVAIGSYPQAPDAAFKVRLTFEGVDEDAVRALADEVCAKVEGTLEVT